LDLRSSIASLFTPEKSSRSISSIGNCCIVGLLEIGHLIYYFIASNQAPAITKEGNGINIDQRALLPSSVPLQTSIVMAHEREGGMPGSKRI
jgi:hypothetical protein